MSEIQKDRESNSSVRNSTVVAVILLGSGFLGYLFASEANDVGALVTSIELGLGLAVVYLLCDIADSVKESVDRY